MSTSASCLRLKETMATLNTDNATYNMAQLEQESYILYNFIGGGDT